MWQNQSFSFKLNTQLDLWPRCKIIWVGNRHLLCSLCVTLIAPSTILTERLLTSKEQMPQRRSSSLSFIDFVCWQHGRLFNELLRRRQTRQDKTRSLPSHFSSFSSVAYRSIFVSLCSTCILQRSMAPYFRWLDAIVNKSFTQISIHSNPHSCVVVFLSIFSFLANRCLDKNGIWQFIVAGRLWIFLSIKIWQLNGANSSSIRMTLYTRTCTNSVKRLLLCFDCRVIQK